MLRKFLAICCVATFVASMVACGGPGEVKKTDAADRNVPGQNADGSEPDTEDPNSGAATGFE